MAIEPIKGFYVHDEETGTDGVAKYSAESLAGTVPELANTEPFKLIEDNVINTSTGIMSLNDVYNTLVYIVRDTNKAVLTVSRGESGTGAVVFNEQQEIVSSLDYSEGVNEIPIPNDGVFLFISIRKTTTLKVGLINEASAIYNAIVDGVDGAPSKTTIAGTYIRYDTGEQKNNATYNTEVFEVVGGSTLYYMEGYNESEAGLSFYDNRGTFISGFLGSRKPQVIAVPANSTVCKASYRNNNEPDRHFVYCKISYSTIAQCLSTLYSQFNDKTRWTGLDMFRSVTFIGDSYTRGSIRYTDDGEWSRALKPYPEVIAGDLGIIAKNRGIGGATAGIYRQEHLSSILSEEQSDLYLIGLGINDAGAHVAIGTTNDIDTNNPTNCADTFIGNMGSIILQIKNTFPTSRMMVFGAWYYGGRQEYRNATEMLCNYLGVPYVDPFEHLFFNSAEWDTMISGHPTQVTYTGMAHAVEDLASNAILNNSSYYYLVGEISI